MKERKKGNDMLCDAPLIWNKIHLEYQIAGTSAHPRAKITYLYPTHKKLTFKNKIKHTEQNPKLPLLLVQWRREAQEWKRLISMLCRIPLAVHHTSALATRPIPVKVNWSSELYNQPVLFIKIVLCEINRIIKYNMKFYHSTFISVVKQNTIAKTTK